MVLYTWDFIHKHIPTKSIGNKSRLPWVNNQLKKLINKKNKLYEKKKTKSHYFNIKKSCFLYIASMSFSFRSGAWF
jgi:hypothetical protein